MVSRKPAMDDVKQIVLPEPFNEVRIPEGLVWQYEATIRAGHVEHVWSLRGEPGAIHISARLTEWDGRHEWSGGIECHWASPPDYMEGQPACHEHCWLLGKPCWHDGTSLGFSEQVAPYLPHAYEPRSAHKFGPYEHGNATRTLVSWYRSKFPDDPALAVRAELERKPS